MHASPDSSSLDPSVYVEEEPSPTIPPGSEGQAYDPLARPMFWIAFVWLLVVAGLIHRTNVTDSSPSGRYTVEVGAITVSEQNLIEGVLLIIWSVIVSEALFRLFFLAGGVRFKESWRTLLYILMPSFRMGAPSLLRRGQIWYPILSWQWMDRKLPERLERLFSIPMVLFAVAILPLFVIEYLQSDVINQNTPLRLSLQASIAIIWVAFAFEFIVKISVAPSIFEYLRRRWLDLAIVILPTLEFVLTQWVNIAPLARLFRLGRALSPAQISRLGRLYRLRGLLMKGWQSFLLLEVFGRILGRTPAKRLAYLEDQLRIKQEEIRDLLEDIAELRKEVEASQAVDREQIDPKLVS